MAKPDQTNEARTPATTTPATTPRGLTRWHRSPFGSLFDRWNDEMDRVFEDFGFGRNWLTRGQRTLGWSPQIEMFQRGNDLVVRADLPGLKKEDVHAEISDDVLTIQGERKQEREEEREGVYRNERTYGSFFRTIPLPEGTIADSAKASFKNGVLEIVLQAPPSEVRKGRRINIE
jgi:HSP20 family protein